MFRKDALKKVLIATADEARAESLSRAFTERGHVPYVVYRGLDALELLKMGFEGKVVLDRGLPDVDHYTLQGRVARMVGRENVFVVNRDEPTARAA